MDRMLPDYSDWNHHNLPVSHYPHHEDILGTIDKCEAICEHMTTLLKKRSDVEARRVQLNILRDCADICGLTSKFIARQSCYDRHIAKLCAQICKSCASECLRFPDSHSQHCAQVCMHCARECEAFAMM